MSDKKRKQKKTKINIKEENASSHNNNQSVNSNSQALPIDSTASNNNSAKNNINESSKTIEKTKVDEQPTAAQLEFQIDDEDNNSGGNKVLGIIAIILGILIMFAGFTAYKYFSESSEGQDNDNVASVDNSVENENNQSENNNSGNTALIPFFDTDSEGITPVSNTSNDTNIDNNDYYGFANNGEVIGVSTTNTESEYVEATDTRIVTVGQNADTGIISTSDSSESKTTTASEANLDLANSSTTWIANNYEPGDIQVGVHQVVRGDTLWELSEGAYGDGSQWHKIAEANNVSYLSNGNPLIVTGTTILIP